MSLLFRIVYSAHARGTHHKLALDALRHLSGPDADMWQRLFLKHADLYMEGAKAPDDQFKDFKNHVLHVGDKFWGGAPEKTESWYRRLVEALASCNWSEAVYCAGIVSHYYTDPIHPFHTGQTEAENNIHRAAEWSISRSYDDLKKIGESQFAPPQITVSREHDWLRDLVIQGAETSHKHYEALIAHYDINKGVVDPPAGLDDVSRRIVGGLVVYAAHGFALILDRAFREAAVAPPDVTLTLETVMAAIKIPVKALLKKLADREDRQQVERMYDELKATGRVEVNLPADDRMVRELYRAEVLAPRQVQQAQARDRRVEAITRSKTIVERAPAAVAPIAPAGGAHSGAFVRPMAARAENATQRAATRAETLTARLAAAPPAPRMPAPPIALETVVLAPRKSREFAAPRVDTSVAAPQPAAPAAPIFAPAGVSEHRAHAERFFTALSAPGGKVADAPVVTVSPVVATAPAPPAPAVVPIEVTASPAVEELPPEPIEAAPVRRMARADGSYRAGPAPAADDEISDAIDSSYSTDAEAADEPAASEPARRKRTRATPAERETGPRFYLNSTDDVVDAPSIGPKMAERLITLGVTTVAELLAADASTLSELLAMRSVKPDTVRDWQDQARLVCDVPGLRGIHAQLLVGAGLRDMFAVADADPATLLVAILRFAQTREGERVLRSGEPPDIEKITAWVDNAVRARQARAA